MRPTNEIDDPTWDDVRDRDALIRRLCHAVAGQFEKDGRPDTVLILDTIDDTLTAIGDAIETDPLPTRAELQADGDLLAEDGPNGYAGTL